MQWQEHHKDAKVLLSQIPTKLQKLLGNKRGRTNKRRNTKFLQDLDLVDSPHKERGLVGEDVDLDLLYLSLK
jgi:hypothetical protein